MADILTTGGAFTDSDKRVVLATICEVFSCTENEIKNLQPLQAGLTNVILSFKLRGGRFVYRQPGLGSDILIDRGRETIVQKVVEDIGVDATLVAMDVEQGWRIGKYIDHRPFKYDDLNDVVRGIMLLRKLHNAPCKVRWEFDVVKQAERIKSKIPPEKYGNFDGFGAIRQRCLRLYELAKNDGVAKCYIHGDARDENFLINDEEIYLIDWEYGGYGDPGFDIGSYVCGGKHTIEDIDRILRIYFRHSPTEKQRRHFFAYVAVTGYFFLHWTMLKESKGQHVGPLKQLWYHYAREISEYALTLYGEKI